MSRYKKGENPFVECIYEGEPCVEFETVGNTKCKVLVDREDWYSYLQSYSWTAIKQRNRITVKTSISNQSKSLWRVIIEHRYDELDYWGTTIDHINNNHLDNRFCNLRIYNAAILNSANISSKYEVSDMQYIHRQGSEANPNGYKIHLSLAGKPYYVNFSVSDYESVEKTIEAAKQFRDEKVFAYRKQVIEEMIKKTRDIEFERGLRDKIEADEFEEIKSILAKYGISTTI